MEAEKLVRCNHCMSVFYEEYIDVDAQGLDAGETCPVCSKGDALMDIDVDLSKKRTIMRRVKTFKWERIGGQREYSKIENGEGVFIQYGCDYEEFENGVGNYSTAIVAMPDGTVKNLSLDLIQFL